MIISWFIALIILTNLITTNECSSNNDSFVKYLYENDFTLFIFTLCFITFFFSLILKIAEKYDKKRG